MIPTLIAFGLVFGRWWRASLAVAVIAWLVALMATDVIGPANIPAAGSLALLNIGLGVLVHQAVLRTARCLRDGGRRPEAA